MEEQSRAKARRGGVDRGKTTDDQAQMEVAAREKLKSLKEI